MFSLKERLRELLIDTQVIKEEDFRRALEEHKQFGGEFSKILVKRNLIQEDQLTLILSEGLDLPPVDITRLKINPEILRSFPQELALKYQVIPIARTGDHWTLALSDPLNIFAIEDLDILKGLKIIPIMSDPKGIAQVLEVYSLGSTATKLEKIIQDSKETEEGSLIKEAMGDMDKSAIEKLTQEAPIIKLTDAIIKQAVLAKASDVFIEPMEKTLRIRYRIDGIIREIDRMSKVLYFPLVSRIKVISNLDISEHRLPQDGRFKTIMEGEKQVDFRVSVLPTIFGENVVFRILDKNLEMLDLPKLGFNQKSLKTLQECSQRPHGMILTCGPTGSGKTTTLYSVLKFIDSPEKNIVTVEDPVEYQMKGINQVNVKPQVGLTFASSLRSILRQDPDVILIGEIRDTETMDIAVKAALTGHLVLSSLHTTTAAGSVIRMMNMGVEPFLMCSSVIAVVAQRLVRRICGPCKDSYAASPVLVEKAGFEKLFGKKKIELYRGRGCPHCFNTGYSGRVIISEILKLTAKVKELILGRVGEPKIKQAGRAEGMTTMREDGLAKALEGVTSLEEVMRVTAPDEELEKGAS